MTEIYASRTSVLDDKHIEEGVCVRIEGGLQNRTFKYKSFEFRCLEESLKSTGAVDVEEAQDVLN